MMQGVTRSIGDTWGRVIILMLALIASLVVLGGYKIIDFFVDRAQSERIQQMFTVDVNLIQEQYAPVYFQVAESSKRMNKTSLDAMKFGDSQQCAGMSIPLDVNVVEGALLSKLSHLQGAYSVDYIFCRNGHIIQSTEWIFSESAKQKP